MKKKIKKKARKKTLKKKKSGAKNKQNSQLKTINLQKVIGFKFQALSKVYENFKKKREIEKSKQDKLESKKREEQIKEEQLVRLGKLNQQLTDREV